MDTKLLKKMFRSDQVPKIALSLQDIPLKAQEMAGRMSISGVQPKLSLKLNRKLGELVLAGEGGEYILKPQIQQFPHLPENEHCCMDLAARLGIEVPPQCLLPLMDGTPAYVVQRFDRRGREKIHQEDFAQILGKKDKYQGSLEQIGEKLREISAVPGLDGQLFFERVVFNFLIGNGDAHSKNFSVLHHEENGTRLSPAYDLVCSRLVIPKEKEDSALTICGKKNNLKRDDFDAFADRLDVPPKIRYETFQGKSGIMEQHIKASRLPADIKKKFIEIVTSRYEQLRLNL